MTLAELRLSIMRYLGSQPERFPATPSNIAEDVIAVVDASRSLIWFLFVPEWTRQNVIIVDNHARRAWELGGASIPIPLLIFVTGPMDDKRTPVELWPDVFSDHDSEYGYPVWQVMEDGSVTEYED